MSEVPPLQFLPFKCAPEPAGRHCVWLRLSGNLTLDRGSLPLFASALGEAQEFARMVIVDLRELDSLARQAVDAIDAAHQASAARVGHCLILVRGSGEVDRQAVESGLLTRVEAIDLQRGGSPPFALSRRAFPVSETNQKENHVRAIQCAG